ncbi:MAG: MMPL family transporter [Bacteroidales bacterium]|nr:MMPL family transporter [Bacteroidales bacterium]
MEGRTPHIPRLLVRYRIWLFVFMTASAVACALLIPHININTNMVVYLPDSSPMKQGMDLLEEQLPGLGPQMEEFGSVFADGNDLMPSDLPKALSIGVALLFVVLLIMSSSVMEVLLFMITVGYAVVINMGTNALLPSVSMLTNNLSSVLQMVLSMDYSIILMNRFRQEKLKGKLPLSAMEGAVDGAASTILSSAFTTIVSLLMLCFIKMKIGADLGIVLAKGVAISLICNFTVLPTLILWGDKGVEATRKKVPALPAAPLARFQERFRVPIAILFLAVFAGFFLLQRRTPLTFSPQWNSTATDAHIQGNALMLLYANEEEDVIPTLLDSIGTDPMVRQCVSYPSLVKHPLTAKELSAMADSLSEGSPEIPQELLQLVYYAHSHPERDERFSLPELQATAEELTAKGMMPEGRFNPEQLMKTLSKPAPKPKPSQKEMADQVGHDEKKVGHDVIPGPSPVIPGPDRETPEQNGMADQVGHDEGKVGHDEGKVGHDEVAETPVVIPDTMAVIAPTPTAPFTYEQATKAYTAAEMAEFTGHDNSQVNTVYRLAGKRRGTMTPKEFVTYVQKNILNKRIYAALIPKGTAQQIADFEAALDQVIAAGPEPIPEPVIPGPDPVIPGPTSVIPGPDRESHEEKEMAEQVGHDVIPGPTSVIPGPDRESPEPELTPQEVLMDMALSGNRYPASELYAALAAAEIPVKPEEIDLLYLYAGAQKGYDPEMAIAPGTLLDYLADTLLMNPAVAGMVPDSTRAMVIEAREQLLSQVGMLRGKDYSAAAILSDYEPESEPTFDYVLRARAAADEALAKPHYWIGESQMYKELKDGFPREVLLLTLLTALSIFLIVALTFRSVLVPFPLVMAVLAGVWANVWASGLGGNTLYYLAYLIVQGILMGATIDYSILFTSYYLNARKSADRKGALEAAYKGSSHSILTSGLILACVPYVMKLALTDPMISAILSSLSIGAAAILIIILFLLPGVLAAIDPILRKR